MGLSDTLFELNTAIEELCREILKTKTHLKEYGDEQSYEQDHIDYCEDAINEMGKAVLMNARKTIAMQRFLDNPEVPEQFSEPEGTAFDPRSSSYALLMEWIEGRLERKAQAALPEKKGAKL